MNNQKGITLITIIITVIIMLILAGVSINFGIGNNGIINNSQKAVEKSDKSEAKEYILETWAYVLSKVENNEMPYNNDPVSLNKKGNSLFKKYISSYGTGYLAGMDNGKYIYKIKIKETNEEFDSYKVIFKLKGNKIEENFYIVNDAKVYDSEEVVEN